MNLHLQNLCFRNRNGQIRSIMWVQRLPFLTYSEFRPYSLMNSHSGRNSGADGSLFGQTSPATRHFGASDGQETYFFSVDVESPAAPEEFSTETGYERAEHPPDMPEMEQDTHAESEDQGGHSTWDGMGSEDERLQSQPACPTSPTFPFRTIVRVSGLESRCN